MVGKKGVPCCSGHLISELTKCAEAYLLIGNLFSFFSEVKTIIFDELNKSVSIWLICITKTLIMLTFLNECEHLKRTWFLMKIVCLSALYRNYFQTT